MKKKMAIPISGALKRLVIIVAIETLLKSVISIIDYLNSNI